jgi:hypothetical protein
MDTLFDSLREKQHQDKTHRLWKNYNKRMMDDCVACTIVFDCDNQPIVCSSISARSCWPDDTYRIYNRLWKPNDRKEYLRRVTLGVGAAGASQIDWLKQHTDFELYFISRETSNWQDWMIDSFKNDHNIHFTKDPYKYLTCPCEQQDACWQYIIYNGNQDILKQWKHR